MGSTLVAACLFSATAFSQQRTGAERPLITSDLIAWTDMQSPRPVPGTTTEPDSLAPANRGPESQTFTGTLLRRGQIDLLRISDQEIYELDNVNEAGRYQGRQVAVLGALQPGQMLIHIFKIEPIP